MKVYVVINEALYADSSYYDVVEVCDSRDKAQVVAETFVKDAIDNKVLGDNVTRTYMANGIRLENEKGYYEEVWISERDVK